MEEDCTRVLLITANVGSIFEEPDAMFPSWLKAFSQCIQNHKPGLVALHCQEVGGKNYEASMQHVNQFIKMLLTCEDLHKYDRARIFLDEDYTASDKFTALGNLYFIHEEVTDVLVWDFVDCKFIEVQGREVLSGNIENVHIKEKAKFPQHFFPEFKWSRKGFLRTRWSINNCIFDLVNIHLFHDASNFVAMEMSPSTYSENRQQALLDTLQRFENDNYSKVPLFIFGDFNFRLDSNLLIQELTGQLVASQTKGKKGQVNKIDYTDIGTGEVVLTVGSKSFDYYDKHANLFASMSKWLQKYDTELSSFRDRLFEHDITFPPSYPFCEDVTDGVSYMKTRVPSWCDRVFLTYSAKEIIHMNSCHPALYDLIGKDVCMGDHKPAYLSFHMKPGKGNSEQQEQPSAFSTTRPLTPAEHSHILSINGELIEGVDFTTENVDLSFINIHDFAKFENENNLIPEFKSNIKDSNTLDESLSEGNHLAVNVTKIKRNRSFQKIAKDVATMEKVLMQWPNRPLSRHHSSSSEDFTLEEYNGFTSNVNRMLEKESVPAESTNQVISQKYNQTEEAENSKKSHESCYLESSNFINEVASILYKESLPVANEAASSEDVKQVISNNFNKSEEANNKESAMLTQESSHLECSGFIYGVASLSKNGNLPVASEAASTEDVKHIISNSYDGSEEANNNKESAVLTQESFHLECNSFTNNVGSISEKESLHVAKEAVCLGNIKQVISNSFGESEEANNNMESAVLTQDSSQLEPVLFEAIISLEPNGESKLGLDKSAFSEGEQLVGCGNGDGVAGDVSMFADRSGCVHVESITSNPSSTPQISGADQSSKGGHHSGKAGEALSAPSSSSRCCSCVVL